ncbi:MAG: bifunctional alpha,alpha-trehalose-phosphate synthase (UDP-forming)/trehalose-phosphatase [Candidatus Aminicenantes bacterium]|nr:bifunctional alpha,alpha-trehalose-phosphate synthase (UDP-forming)/trehalose-phosphatase [Candidatus Aminicenantes bacterium]
MKGNKKSKGKIIIVSNRLPVTISKRKDELKIQQSPGGLATCLRAIQEEEKAIFVGWPGYWPANDKEKRSIENELINYCKSYPVFISPAEIGKYYYGFANRTLWPLFHYFSTYCAYEESEWIAYKKVNQRFFQKVFDLADPQDTFWIHDYHLMLLPALIRKSLPQSSIGFFLHIPFPSSEIFRVLPWRQEILEGFLGADLIGFHTYEYAQHFLNSVLLLLGYEHEFGAIQVDNRIVKVENFPMGIDSLGLKSLLEESSIQKEIKKLEEKIWTEKRKIILSVDRLDYTKGIPQRLKGIELFLEKKPEWHGRFTYVMLCVPSRTKVKHYSLLKEEVDSLVGRINGRFGMPGWIPVHYMYRSLPFNKLLPLYTIADVALVTPLRDGMNLVAKEYVASKKDNRGVLVLSETAGAASELGEALLVNVNNKEDIASALTQALDMSEEEQARGMKLMRKRLFEYDVLHWARSFVQRTKDVKKIQSQREHRKLNVKWEKKLISDFKKSKNRLLFLDYDGTLVSFAMKPEQAKPDVGLKRLLFSLGKDPHNTLVIVSGRDRTTIEHWLGKVPCGLVAEHGAWIKRDPRHDWEKQKSISGDWKEQLKPILKTYEFRVPGSLMEEKEYGIAWHYRKANPELGQLRSSELFDYLNEFLANTDLQVMHGNKVIEVRVSGINKGDGVMPWLSEKKWDFILALGDDWTDEDLFKILPAKAYSIKVSYGPSQARFYLESSQLTRSLLHKLVRIQK